MDCKEKELTAETRRRGAGQLLTLKLYLVRLRGLSSSCYGVSYVIAADAEGAYQMVKSRVDRMNLGYTKDRILQSVNLVAEAKDYTDTGAFLHVDFGLIDLLSASAPQR